MYDYWGCHEPYEGPFWLLNEWADCLRAQVFQFRSALARLLKSGRDRAPRGSLFLATLEE